jgi:hypothetical protein
MKKVAYRLIVTRAECDFTNFFFLDNSKFYISLIPNFKNIDLKY